MGDGAPTTEFVLLRGVCVVQVRVCGPGVVSYKHVRPSLARAACTERPKPSPKVKWPDASRWSVTGALAGRSGRSVG